MVEDAVREMRRRQTDAVEAMIERMLVTPGEYGVAVYNWTEGYGGYMEVRLSTDVEPMTVAYLDGPPPELNGG